MEVLLDSPNAGDQWAKDLTINEFISTTPVQRKPVPNHLTDTKIFSATIKKNARIKASPSAIYFPGFSLGTTLTKKFKICNSSSDRQNMHIISPSTKYFSVKYTKPRRFVPGFTMDVTVFFTADEWRYYYDCIRLHCEGEENIIIPLHAYPVMDLSGFPSKLVFDTAGSRLGKTRQKFLSLKSPDPVEFEYQISILQSNPVFTVKPLSGYVPGEGELMISVQYTPTEYVTSHMKMQLKVSEFNSKPLTCAVMASCVPNLQKKSIKDSDEMFKKTKILDPRSLSLLQISRRRKTTVHHPPQTKDGIEYEGLYFPSQLNTQHAVNSVLIQKAGKLRAKDMRDAAASTAAREGHESTGVAQISSRQMKEAAFKQELAKNEMEERANHLRWQVHRGSEALTEDERLEILRERERMMLDYKYRIRCEPDEEAELQRRTTVTVMRRTFREAHYIPDYTPKFDLYKDNPWFSRHRALERFQQAARTVLIRQRADKKVRLLRKLIKRFKDGNIEQQLSGESSTQLQLDVRTPATPSTRHKAEFHYSISAAKIKPFTFPVYVKSDGSDNLSTNEVTEVETSPTSISLQQNVPYHNLKVPKQFQMLGYSNTDVDMASRSYVSPAMAHPLRVGADDELIEVSIPSHLLAEDEQKLPQEKQDEQESRPTSQISDVQPSPELVTENNLGASSGLSMPHGMLHNPPHHPLQIFNPFPGMQMVHLPFSQSEVDPDYHLCPIPRYTMLPGRDQYFVNDDVINGIMTWKNFPPQGIVALSKNDGTLAKHDLPRWSDPFAESMLPNVTPDLLSPPEKEDEPPPDFGTSVESLELFPEMIREEFKVDESDIIAVAIEEEEEREYKPPEAPKSTETHDDNLQTKILLALKKFESLDKSRPKILFS